MAHSLACNYHHSLTIGISINTNSVFCPHPDSNIMAAASIVASFITKRQVFKIARPFTWSFSQKPFQLYRLQRRTARNSLNPLCMVPALVFLWTAKNPLKNPKDFSRWTCNRIWLGLFALIIKGGKDVKSIDWGDGEHFLKVDWQGYEPITGW